MAINVKREVDSEFSLMLRGLNQGWTALGGVLSPETMFRAAGYIANLCSDEGVHGDLDVLDAYAEHLETLGYESVPESWYEAFEQGWMDAIGDPTAMLSVTEAAERAGYYGETLPTGRAYIKAEIGAKRLAATKQGKQWSIREDDLLEWLANPRRGSRSKSE
jgi:hypothetical protein